MKCFNCGRRGDVNILGTAITLKNALYVPDLKAFNNKGLFLYKSVQNKCNNATVSKDALNNAIKWHNRFGHVNFNCWKYMSIKKTVLGSKFGKIVPDFVGETCAESKA